MVSIFYIGTVRQIHNTFLNRNNQKVSEFLRRILVLAGDCIWYQPACYCCTGCRASLGCNKSRSQQYLGWAYTNPLACGVGFWSVHTCYFDSTAALTWVLHTAISIVPMRYSDENFLCMRQRGAYDPCPLAVRNLDVRRQMAFTSCFLKTIFHRTSCISGHANRSFHPNPFFDAWQVAMHLGIRSLQAFAVHRPVLIHAALPVR